MFPNVYLTRSMGCAYSQHLSLLFSHNIFWCWLLVKVLPKIWDFHVNNDRLQTFFKISCCWIFSTCFLMGNSSLESILQTIKVGASYKFKICRVCRKNLGMFLGKSCVMQKRDHKSSFQSFRKIVRTFENEVILIPYLWFDKAQTLMKVPKKCYLFFRQNRYNSGVRSKSNSKTPMSKSLGSKSPKLLNKVIG